MLISLCQLILEGMLLTTDSGEYHLASFIDEQRMNRLYEKFILEYYAKECPQVTATASQIQWALGDHMAMDMDTGDIHMISSWSDDDEE